MNRILLTALFYCSLGSCFLVLPTAAAEEPAKDPAWKAEFREAYGLKDGEWIRRVPPPYPKCRAVYFSEQNREHYRKIKREVPEAALKQDYSKYFTKFGWKDGWTVDDLTMHQVPVQPEKGTTLGQLLHMTTGFHQTRIDATGPVLAQPVTGDFVVRAGAAPEKVAAALETILRRDCEVAVSLKVVEDERHIYVVSGKYKAEPLPDRKENEIEVFAIQTSGRDGGGGGTGTLAEFASHVEGFINAPVALEEVAGAPRKVEWHFNFRSPFTDAQFAQDHDAETVMNNIASQTGLTVKLEKRKFKVLVVEEAE
jgi:hypothetical protein